MKKKILAVLLSLTILLGIMPTAVFAADADIVAKIGDVTYTDLQEAFKEAVEGDTVELTADVVLNGAVTATHSGIFDLGGYTVKLANVVDSFIVRSSDLTVTNGNIEAVDNADGDEYIAVASGGKLTLEDCTVSITNMDSWKWAVVNYGTFVLGENADLSINGPGAAIAAIIPVSGSTNIIDGGTVTAVSTKSDSYGVYLAYGGSAELRSGTITGSSTTNAVYAAVNSVFNMTGGEIKDTGTSVQIANQAVFNMTGGKISGVNRAISGNGTDKTQYTTINLGGDASVSSTGVAIYQPQNGEINISDDAYLEGDSAIGIKSGTINITGGTVCARGTYEADPSAISSGLTTDGSTIVIDDQGGNYYGNVEINISGGDLVSDYGHNISVTRAVVDDPANDPDHKPPVVTISGGNFYSAENTFRMTETNNASNANIIASGGFVLKGDEADMSVEYKNDAHGDAGYLAGKNLTVDRSTGEIRDIRVAVADSFGGTVTAASDGLNTFTLTAEAQSADYVLAGLTVTDADGKRIAVNADGSITDNSDGCLTVSGGEGVYTVTSHCDISVMPVFVSAENNSVIDPPVISVDASLVDGIEDEHLEDTSVTLPEEELENILKEVNDTIGTEEARQALEDADILPEGSTDEVYLQIATEIKVVVLAYDDAPNTPNILQLEITPYYHVYATTNPATPVIIGEEQGEDFVLLDSAEYRISGTDLNIPMVIPLPETFASVNSLISIEHEHTDYNGAVHHYFSSARVKEDGTISFRNRHGFSVFTFTVDTTCGLDDLQVLDTERDLIYPLNPEFDTDVLEYEVYVLNYVNYVQIMPTVDAEGLIITVNGVVVTSGDWSDYIPLEVGKNVITVKVSDGDDESSLYDNVYTIIIYRAGPDSPEVPGVIEIPEDPDIPDDPKTPDVPDGPEKSPQTGRAVQYGSMLIMFTAVLAGVELFINRKRKFFGADSK